MIITKDFVLLNYPKTGSSFTRTILKKIHDKKDSGYKSYLIKLGLLNHSLTGLMLPNIFEKNMLGLLGQHGVFCQIPKVHSNK